MDDMAVSSPPLPPSPPSWTNQAVCCFCLSKCLPDLQYLADQAILSLCCVGYVEMGLGARLFRHVTYMYVSGKMTSNWGEGLLVFSECSEMHTFD